MASVHLLYLILITIITTITNYSCGELFLRMPLTINPVVQDIITRQEGSLLHRFYNLDPNYYSQLTPAHMVVKLNESLSFVMRKSIDGAVVLGIAAKAAGLTAHNLYNLKPYSKWCVNVSLTEIQSILKHDERHLVPISVNITIRALQGLGFRALQRRYNVTIPSKIAEPLYTSSAYTYSGLVEDWIRVVRFITKASVLRLASKHKVTIATLAHAFHLTTVELYRITLQELDQVLATKLTFVDGSLIVVTTTPKFRTTQVQTHTVEPRTTIKQSSTARNSPSIGEKETTASSYGSKIFSTRTVSTVFSGPSEGSSTGGAMSTMNMAVYIGAPVGLLLFIIASSTWCFRRKRRRSRNNGGQERKTKNNNDIKLNNLWIDKESSPNQEEVSRQEPRPEVFHTRSLNGIDSRFKGLQYGPTSSTFTVNAPIIRTSMYLQDYEHDSRTEIFV